MLRGFYFITDRGLSRRPEVDVVREALEGGAKIVQYREKDLPVEDMIRTASKLRLMCSGRALFIVNDEAEVAMAVDADGLHIGQDDMSLKTARYILGKDKLIGVTVHSVEQAVAADEGGADYVAVSPIFPTATKKDAGEPVGLQMLRDVKAKVTMPVAAIGGINESNVDSVIEAGADMVSSISATVGKQDIRSAVKYFSTKWTK
ncbi:MAG: thiamine phosphate synthase [Candidatus Altiarchaeota archaeon]